MSSNENSVLTLKNKTHCQKTMLTSIITKKCNKSRYRNAERKLHTHRMQYECEHFFTVSNQQDLVED